MRRLVAITCILAVTAGAGSIKLVSWFDAKFNPGGSWTLFAMSIEYDGQYLWTTVDGRFLKRTYPGGSIVATYDVGQGYIWSCGLAYDGKYLYTTNCWRTYQIHKFDPVRGGMVGSFPAPRGLHHGGLAYGGGYLYFADWEEDAIYKLRTDGSIVGSFPTGFDKPWSLAYVGNRGAPYLVCSTRPGIPGDGNAVVYCLTTTGSILDWAMWPYGGKWGGAAGLGYDGKYLWGILNDGPPLDNLALKMRYISEIGIKPVSFGKIKTLFR